MIGFGRQVERLRERQRFAARMHNRPDILNPRANDSRWLPDLLDQLDPVLDYAPDAAAEAALGGTRCPLPYGIRSVRYSLSPVVQDAIGPDDRVGGMLVRRMPQTLDDTIAFIAASCPVAEQNWPELRRLIYVDPAVLAELIYPLKRSHEPIFRLILSREYHLAFSRCRTLADIPPNTLGYRGRLIDLCVAFGEMERCDFLAMGLAARQVDSNSVKEVLLDHKRMLGALEVPTPEGEYLIGLLANPQLLVRGTKGKRPWYGPWNSPDPLAYDPLEDFEDPERYHAFVDDVLASPLLGPARSDGKRMNSILTTYWGADLSQLAEIAFIAAGDTVRMRRGAGIADDELSEGRGLREHAIRVLADGFRERHDPNFRATMAKRRDEKAEAWRKADEQERSPTDDAAATPVDLKVITVGASRIQQNRDRTALLVPQAGMHGHEPAIDGLMWLSSRGDRALWEALCSKPPTRDWLDRRGIDAAAKRAFEALRAVRASAPQLFHRRRRGDARLMSQLATGIGFLSGQPQFAQRVQELVSCAPKLRLVGWLPSRLGGRWGGGGHLANRNANRVRRTPSENEVVRLTYLGDQPS